MTTTSITHIEIFVPEPPTQRKVLSMFINIFGSRSKSITTVDTDRPRKRSVGQKGVRFNNSRVVYYTHSKTDYDRGGMSWLDDDKEPTVIVRTRSTSSIRPPVLDSDDEDSLEVDLDAVSKSSTRNRRTSFRFA
jgi:hypothetical protein